jgi:hypothetical protein
MSVDDAYVYIQERSDVHHDNVALISSFGAANTAGNIISFV